MKTINKILIISTFALTLNGCSGLFDKDNTPPPSQLVNFTPEAKVQALWNTHTGDGADKEYLKLVPASDNNVIYTASYDGTVTATDQSNGKILWDVQINSRITSGVGADSNIVVVGGREGDVFALNQTNGETVWTAKVSSEILATPKVTNRMTLIKTIDGKLTAFSNADGHVLWKYQQVEPNLILRGASTPQTNSSAAVVGFANGNLVKLNLRDGNLMWQKALAMPEGSFAIQRMIDIDADPLITNQRVYAATYQGHIAALNLGSGEGIWTHDISSYTGIAADAGHAYVTDAKSHVWAFEANSGNVSWRQPELESRNITAPASMGDYLVIGDAEGYLHWLSKQDGHFIARTKVGGSGIFATPLVINNIIYVLTKDGHLAAYTLS